MSQSVYPPPAQPNAGPPAPGSVAIVDAVPPGAQPTQSRYQLDPPRRPSRFWAVVKWPLRQIVKAIYLTGSAANRHRAIALVMLVVLIVLGGGSYAVYQYTHPAAPARTSPGQTISGAVSNGHDTPFTISNSSLPLGTAVINFLEACKKGDAQELAANTAPLTQVGGTLFNGRQGTFSASDWPSLIQFFQSHGILFQQFIYNGGYLYPDGNAGYTVEAVVGLSNQPGILVWTWYFTVGIDGHITSWQDLTPSPQATATP